MGKYKDLTGERFGRLVVISKSNIRKYKDKRLSWNCICNCGNIVIKSGWELKNGNTKSCGCLRKEFSRKQYREASFNTLLSIYMRNAEKNNRCFKLTKEQFYKLTSSNCYYCGQKPEKKLKGNKKRKFYGDYLFNGIDRYNNDKGYTEDNCVPCCFACNQMKSKMTKEKFIEQIERIHHHIHRFDIKP